MGTEYANETYYRVLGVKDTFRRGDTVYNIERHEWEPIMPEMNGLAIDPTSMPPCKRKFRLPKDQIPNDMAHDEVEPLKWNLKDRKEECLCLVQQKGGAIEVEFDPRRMTPAKDWIWLPTTEGHMWMQMEQLEKLTVELLDEMKSKPPKIRKENHE